MDDQLADVFSGDLKDWVGALPSYQSEVIAQMLVAQDPIDVALAWLGSTGPSNTESFGAIRNAPGVFYSSLLEQIKSLLCSEKENIGERKELFKSAKAGRAALVTAASGFIAPHLGISAIVLAPAVALTLAVVSRAGQESICVTLSQLIADRRSTDSPTQSDQVG
jgi:hypothetical protein